MLLVYPDKLGSNFKIKMILDYLNHPYTYDINDDYDIVFNSSLAPLHRFGLNTDKFVINGRCNNVLKDYVDRVWGDVYGCCLTVNPLIHNGYCIEKPLTQGTNSGNVILCPHEKSQDKIYLRWVDTRDENGSLNDYRVVICDGEIVLVLIKKKQYDSFFSFDMKNFIQRPWEELFSVTEKNHILEFSDIVGLDFGEIDVLRSNFDGKIYVVDVNNLSGYGYFRDKEYVHYLSNIFKRAYLS